MTEISPESRKCDVIDSELNYGFNRDGAVVSKTRNLVQSQVRLTAISQSIASHFLDSGEISVIALQSLWICDAIDSQSHARIAHDSELNDGSKAQVAGRDWRDDLKNQQSFSDLRQGRVGPPKAQLRGELQHHPVLLSPLQVPVQELRVN